jgi:CRISPR-associated endonuclease Cas1
MAARLTVPQLSSGTNPVPVQEPTLVPRRGVITLFGYGTSVRVDRGHLVLTDGIASTRRAARFARVGHGLHRLVIIGSDGMVSFAALRWLADQHIGLVMLERDGRVLATTGPVHSSDSRLRRAQSLAHESCVGLTAVRFLLDRKLAGQEHLAREMLRDGGVASLIANRRTTIHTAPRLELIRRLEAQAALAYWSAWRTVPVTFPTKDSCRVPKHWQAFGARRSPLSGSRRSAVNPANAILNYLYAVLESESRLSAATLGLDPGIGLLHVDVEFRDSLALDLMEAVRPDVDRFVLNWIQHYPLRREWFFEQRDGSCRLMGSFAAQLSETAATWRTAIAPVAERVASLLWATVRGKRSSRYPTRLTEQNRRAAQGSDVTKAVLPRPPSVCPRCGDPIRTWQTECGKCAPVLPSEHIPAAIEPSVSRQIQARRAAAQRRHKAALRHWNPRTLPKWLTEIFYLQQIQPQLVRVPLKVLCNELGVSRPFASSLRTGTRRPHPRHWLALATLVGIKDQ